MDRNNQLGGGGDQPQLLTNRLVRCLCQLPCVTCNRALPGISNILRKHFNILHPSHHCKDVFKQPPFVAYRRNPNLRDLLVKAQLPVIYIIQCNCCNFQYIGETKRRLKDRFNEHRHSVDKKPTTVSEHFLSHSDHSHTDTQLIPLEKIRFSRDSVRNARSHI